MIARYHLPGNADAVHEVNAVVAILVAVVVDKVAEHDDEVGCLPTDFSRQAQEGWLRVLKMPTALPHCKQRVLG